MKSDTLVKACMQFIERHAEGCVRSDGWLELPKDAVIKLISSDTVGFIIILGNSSGCRIRVKTLGNIESKSSLPSQN